MKFASRLLLPILLISAFTGCSAEKSARTSTTAKPSVSLTSTREQLLLSQLKGIDVQCSLLASQVNARRQLVGQLESRVNQQQANIREYEGRVQRFMLNHKMAVGCIALGVGGTAVALDPHNEFSPDEKNWGTMGAIIAGCYLLANWDEVTFVIDQLGQADAHQKRLKQALATSQRELNHYRSDLLGKLRTMADYSRQANSLRSQLKV